MAFKAYMIHQEEGKVASRFVDMDEAQLDAGEVIIKVAYSSVNYKDALAATGAGRIIRRFPCVGGIDLDGTVIASRDPRFAAGDSVVATSYDIGVAHHGGYAEVARIPADWVLKLPAGLTLQEAMSLGTAGFTAGLAVARMEHDGLKPANGPVVVSGATGGVGSIAIQILAGLGYHVVALTGRSRKPITSKDWARRKSCCASPSTSPRSSPSAARPGPARWTTWAAMCCPGWPAP